MAEEKHKYVVRLEVENGRVVNTTLEQLGASGKKSFELLEKSALRADQRISFLGSAIMTRLVPALSAGALGRALINTTQELHDLNDAAEALGVTAQDLQTFRIIGASDSEIGEFVKRIGEAQQGFGKLLPVLEHYGVELKDINGETRNWKDILEDISTIIATADDPEERRFIAARAGMEGFLDELQKGPKHLQDLADAAVETGQTFDEHVVKQAEQFDKEWDAALRKFNVLWKSTLVKAIQDWKDFFNIIRGNNPFEDIGRIDLQIDQMESRRDGFFYKNFAGIRSATERRIAELKEKRTSVIFSPENIGDLDAAIVENRALEASGSKFNRKGSVKETIEAREEAERAAKEAIRDAERQKERIDKLVETLGERNEQIRLGSTFEALYADALGVVNVEQELHIQLSKENIDLKTEEGQKIKEQVENYARLTDAQRKSREEVQRLVRAADDIGDAFGSAFEEAALEGKGFGEVLSGLGKEIEKIFFRAFVSEPISKFVSGMADDIFSSFGGFKAEGGPLEQNKWYIAGEKGPEPIWGGGAGAFAMGYPALGGSPATAPTAVRVEVVNQTSQPVQSRSVVSNQGRDIQVILTDAFARDLATGRFDREMRTRYGLSPATV